MPLQKRNIDLTFDTVGMQASGDPKLKRIPGLLCLENAELGANLGNSVEAKREASTAAIVKRAGYRQIYSGSEIDAKAFFRHNAHLYAYEPTKTLNQWTDEEPTFTRIDENIPHFMVTDTRVLYSDVPYFYHAFDCAYADNRLFVTTVRMDQTSFPPAGGRLYVFDATSRAYQEFWNIDTSEDDAVAKVAPVTTSGSSDPTHVLVYYTVYESGVGKLYERSYNLSTGVLGSKALMLNGVDGSEYEVWFDVCYYGDYAWITCCDTSGDIRVWRRSSSGAAGNNTYAGSFDVKQIAIHQNLDLGGDEICILFTDTTDGVRQVTYNGALSSQQHATVVDATTFGRLGALCCGDTSYFKAVWTQTLTSEGKDHDTYVRPIAVSDGAVGDKKTYYGTTLIHKGVNNADDFPLIGIQQRDYRPTAPAREGVESIAYTAMVHEYPTYGTEELFVVGKYAHQILDGQWTTRWQWVCGVAQESATKHHWVTGIFVHQYVDGTDVTGNAALALCTIDKTPTRLYSYTEFARLTVFAGGLPFCWDGVRFNEIGFSHAPIFETATPGENGSGAMALGTYSYIAVFERYDGLGQRYLSITSAPYSVTLSGSQNSVTLQAYTPILHARSGGTVEHHACVGFYRTEASGSVYYRLNPLEDLTDMGHYGANEKEQYVDLLADASITGNEILYTNGGALDRYAPPACDLVETHDRRLWCAAQEALWYSQEDIEGEPPFFHPILSIPYPERHVRPTALVSIGHSLVVFWENYIGVVQGQGPNSLGQGSTYQLQRLPFETGCSDRRWVCQVPTGVVFQSRHGLQLLTTDLGRVVPIGAPIDALLALAYSDIDTNAEIVDCVHMEDRHQARFAIAGTGGSSNAPNYVVVWDYELNRWWLIGMGYADAVTERIQCTAQYDGRHIVALASGLILAQDNIRKDSSPTYKDAFSSSDYYPTRIMTPWIPLAGLQGYQRIYKVLLLGEYKSTHDLKLDIWYDYNNATSADDTITVDSTVLSGLGQYQIEFGIPQQRCQAIKLMLTLDTDTDDVDSACATLSGITLVCGVKRGTMRLPAEARV